MKRVITNAVQAKYVATLLRGGGSGLERLSQILMDARVDLQPHQVLSAIEALDNPWSKGRMLTDSVGLGKTVQAAILIAELWHRGQGEDGEQRERPNIIVVVPAMLKEQWAEELQEKFYLPTQILEDKGEIIRHGEAVQICSYQYCHNNEKQLAAIKWDAVVMDEAHFLRNLHTGNNVIAGSVARIFRDTYKLLLTASPIQNSLLDLYSIASLIDENLFLDLESFKEKFIYRDNSRELSERLSTIMSRTIRSQVLEYINYTDRYSITQEFELSEEEKQLYEAVLKYCDSKDERGKFKVTGLQRMLLLKELASSPQALLEAAKNMGATEIVEAAEWVKKSGKIPSKLKALDDALAIGFANLAKLGANQKAVIFTESLATQKYIVEHLSKSFRPSEILTLNGSSRRRSEIIDDFRHRSTKILVSTEVGGQGLNLQHCSFVLNFDLPWNPQRIEQRIGRCHRYGQKHDVCVVNFLAKDNYADARLYELLTHKLKLFEGVFGASDLVLGVLEDVDFEKRISEIYKSCRTKEEIDAAFEALQSELATEIKTTKNNAKQKVFEFLERDVAHRFKGIGQELGLILSRKETLLWELTKYIIGGQASFSDEDHSFIMSKGSYDGKRLKGGIIYRMDKSEPHATRYRLGNPLAQRVLNKAQYNTELSSARATYKLKVDSGEWKVIENIMLQNNFQLSTLNFPLCGVLGLYRIKRKGAWFADSFALVGRLDDGTILNHEMCEKILMLQASDISLSRIDRDDDGNFERHVEMVSEDKIATLQPALDGTIVAYTKRQHDSTLKYFEQFVASVNAWADDKIAKVQKRLKAEKQKLEALKSTPKMGMPFDKKIALDAEVKKLQLELADRQIEADKEIDEIRIERDRVIANNAKLSHATYIGELDFILQFNFLPL